VRLEFVVGTDGRAEIPSVKVVAASGALFVDPAIATLRECKFRPGTKAGHNVRTLSVVTVWFAPEQ
jgi:outer membrane biosynthesis protein TonB